MTPDCSNFVLMKNRRMHPPQFPSTHRLASTRATTVNGLKLKASYASTEGKLADSIVKDILQL